MPSSVLSAHAHQQPVNAVAIIRELDSQRNRALVEVKDEQRTWAQLPASRDVVFQTSDKVLLVGDGEELYITTLLKRAQTEAHTQASAKSSYVEISGNHQEQIKVYAKPGELIFHYDAVTGHAKVNIPKGHLEFISEQGDIEFKAAGQIRLQGDNINVSAGQSLNMGIDSATAQAAAISPTVTMNQAQCIIQSDEFSVTARESSACFNRAQILGKSLTTKLTHAKWHVQNLETVTDILRQKSKNIFQSISGLMQTKAQRQRTHIEETAHTKAKEIYINTENDYKVRADQIHLG